jgi:hypothetical protein
LPRLPPDRKPTNGNTKASEAAFHWQYCLKRSPLPLPCALQRYKRPISPPSRTHRTA